MKRFSNPLLLLMISLLLGCSPKPETQEDFYRNAFEKLEFLSTDGERSIQVIKIDTSRYYDLLPFNAISIQEKKDFTAQLIAKVAFNNGERGVILETSEESRWDEGVTISRWKLIGISENFTPYERVTSLRENMLWKDDYILSFSTSDEDPRVYWELSNIDGGRPLSLLDEFELDGTKDFTNFSDSWSKVEEYITWLKSTPADEILDQASSEVDDPATHVYASKEDLKSSEKIGPQLVSIIEGYESIIPSSYIEWPITEDITAYFLAVKKEDGTVTPYILEQIGTEPGLAEEIPILTPREIVLPEFSAFNPYLVAPEFNFEKSTLSADPNNTEWQEIGLVFTIKGRVPDVDDIVEAEERHAEFISLIDGRYEVTRKGVYHLLKYGESAEIEQGSSILKDLGFQVFTPPFGTFKEDLALKSLLSENGSYRFDPCQQDSVYTFEESDALYMSQQDAEGNQNNWKIDQPFLITENLISFQANAFTYPNTGELSATVESLSCSLIKNPDSDSWVMRINETYFTTIANLRHASYKIESLECTES